MEKIYYNMYNIRNLQEMNPIFIILLVASINVQFSLAQRLQWRSITPHTGTVPPVRRYSGMAWTPAALYVFGGQGEDGALGEGVKL